MNRLRAYTLMEVTIAMVILGVISAMALFIFQHVHEFSQGWWQFQQKGMDYERCIEVMHRDINLADAAVMDGSQLVLLRDSQEIRYAFRPGVTRIENGGGDLLWPKAALQQVHFVDHSPLVDTLSIQMEINEEASIITLGKRYSFQQILSAHGDSNQLDNQP